MKHMITLAASAALILSVGCGGNSTSPTAPGQSGSTEFTGVNAIVSLRIDGPATLTVGDTAQLKVIATVAGGTTLDVTAKAVFSISNSSVASVSASGQLKALAPGDCGLTALVGSVSANLTARVKAKDIISRLEIRGKTTLDLGETSQLQIIAVLDTGSEIEVTGKATLSSSNDAVVRVSASGALQAVGIGTGDVLSLLDDVKATAKVNVNRGQIVRLDVIGKGDMFVGDTDSVQVMGTTSNGAQVNVTPQTQLSSSNNSVLKVSDGGAIEAVGPGSCELIAINGGVRAALKLNVSRREGSILKLRIEGATNLKMGQVAQLKVFATLDNNTEIEVTGKVAWSMSNGNCCLVNLLGLVTALAPGDCLLTGVLDGVTVTVPVKVSL
jgi:hypothetical protein